MVEDFLRRYPLSLRETLVSPLVFRHVVPELSDAPHPGDALLRDLARFAGHRDGAIRTALSRLRSSGELERFTDKAGRDCYHLNDWQLVVSAVAAGEQHPDGVIVAITTFHKGQETHRKYVRQLLEYSGFQPLARNAFVNGIVDTSPVEKALEERGIRESLWLFRSQADDPALLTRLAQVFDVGARARVLEQLRVDLEAFLGEPGIDGREFSRRIMCVGPIQYRICFQEEPPLPSAILPADYPLVAARTVLARFLELRGADLLEHFKELS